MQNSLTSSSLTFKAWMKEFNSDNGIESHLDLFTRNFIRKSVKGGRVSANISKFESNSLDKIIDILQRNLNSKEVNIIELMRLYNLEKDEKIKNNMKEELKNLNINDYLMAFDANSLYPSAMYDDNSEYPVASSAKPISDKQKLRYVKLFNEQTFRPRCGIFSVFYTYPDNLFFQPIPAKDVVKKDTGEKVDLIRFRNGEIFDTLTSVDIQEIVRCGGKILKIYDGIVYSEIYTESPFKSYVKKMFEYRLKFKSEKNDVADSLVKLLLNSLYGKTFQKDIVTTSHVWSEETLRSNFTELIKNYEEILNGLYYVEKKIEENRILEIKCIYY